MLHTILPINLSVFAMPMKITPSEAEDESTVGHLQAAHSCIIPKWICVFKLIGWEKDLMI